MIKRKVFKKRIELIPLPFCKNGMIRKPSKQLNEIIKQFLTGAIFFMSLPSVVSFLVDIFVPLPFHFVVASIFLLW